MSSRVITGISWTLLLAAVAGFGVLTEEALLQHGRGDAVTMTFTGCCATGLLILEAARAWLRRRGRHEFRESSGRSHNPAARKGTAGQVAANAVRLDRHSGEIRDLAALRDDIEALRGEVGGLTAALEVSHHLTPQTAPASVATPWKRELYVVRDEPDTKPFPQIA